MRRRLWLCLAGGLISVFFSHDAVLAHDHEHPELKKWFESLKSGKGPCCDGCAYRKSHPAILMVQSAQDRTTDNASRVFGSARYRRVLVQ